MGYRSYVGCTALRSVLLRFVLNRRTRGLTQHQLAHRASQQRGAEWGCPARLRWFAGSRHMVVCLTSLVAFLLAPALSSISTTSAKPPNAALCRAVSPFCV